MKLKKKAGKLVCHLTTPPFNWTRLLSHCPTF